MATTNFLPLPSPSTTWSANGANPENPVLVGALYINGDLWNTAPSSVGGVTQSYDAGTGSLTTTVDFTSWIPPGNDFTSGNPAGFPNVSFGLSPYGGPNTSPPTLELPATLNAVMSDPSLEISASYSVQNSTQVPIDIAYDTFITQNPAQTVPPGSLSGTVPAYVGNYFDLEIALYQNTPIKLTPVSTVTIPTLVNGQSVDLQWNAYVFPGGGGAPEVLFALSSPPDPSSGVAVGILPGDFLAHLTDSSILAAINANSSTPYNATSIDDSYLDNIYFGSEFFPTQDSGSGNYQANYSYTINSLSVSGASAAASDLNGDGRSDVLFENGTTGNTGYWLTDSSGAVTGFDDLAKANTTYTIAGVGDFDGSGHSEILFENKITGDTGYWVTDGSGAVTGFHDFGDADTAYTIVGIGDFDGDGRSDVLFENKATGDTGYWTTNSSGAVTGFHDFAHANTAYAIVGVGDFDDDGRSDVLFQNKATGDTGYWTTDSSGAVTGFHDFGAADTAYSIVGVGDFDGSGHSEILFESTSTGDTGYWLTDSSGTVTGFHDFGDANTAYSIVGVGDYDGDGRSDVLFQNKATGDTGYWVTNSSAFVTGFHDFASADTSYAVIGL